jgi:hypothetical protein
LITTFADDPEAHPEVPATVNVYVPAARPVTVVVVPVPVEVEPPGFLVRVHVPVAGNPLNTTLPVATVQVGCVAIPGEGAEGVAGCEFITASPEASEMQPDRFVTVKVYVPATRPEIVVTVPVPVEVIPPGFPVTVHVPEEGNPLIATLPVAKEQVGCVIVPTVGDAGVDGCGLITTFPDSAEVHPEVPATVNVYVPAESPVTVVAVPVPVEIIPPGFLVKVHVPVDGKPLNATLPVETVQVGCVTVPVTGGSGIEGGDSTFAETGSETHALSVIDRTSIVCRPAGTPVKVTPACQVPPSRLYSKLPVGAVMFMVPAGSAQVGCVISNVAIAGSGGGSSIVAEADGDMQVLSVVDLTSRV